MNRDPGILFIKIGSTKRTNMKSLFFFCFSFVVFFHRSLTTRTQENYRYIDNEDYHERKT